LSVGAGWNLGTNKILASVKYKRQQKYTGWQNIGVDKI
jgi:hypothetical protein